MSTNFFVFESLLTMLTNVLPLHLKQTFPPIIWIFTEGEGDGIESRLPFKIFFYFTWEVPRYTCWSSGVHIPLVMLFTSGGSRVDQYLCPATDPTRTNPSWNINRIEISRLELSTIHISRLLLILFVILFGKTLYFQFQILGLLYIYLDCKKTKKLGTSNLLFQAF